MKIFLVFICSLLISNLSLTAQKNKLVTVKAGTRILDYFPVHERYRYPVFTDGQVFYKNNAVSSTRFNYNLLSGEMEFIQLYDTLSIAGKKNILFITVAKDTFFYDNGYIELISGGPVKVGLKQYFKLKEVLKKDTYGTSSSGGASTSYGSLPVGGNFYKLIANEDLVFQKIQDYYISSPSNEFVPFRKKTVIKLYPGEKDTVKAYLKSNRIDFNSVDDLLNLADYLQGL
jgi:hypothetical protein